MLDILILRESISGIGTHARSSESKCQIRVEVLKIIDIKVFGHSGDN